jgi:hypothetical protein
MSQNLLSALDVALRSLFEASTTGSALAGFTLTACHDRATLLYSASLHRAFLDSSEPEQDRAAVVSATAISLFHHAAALLQQAGGPLFFTPHQPLQTLCLLYSQMLSQALRQDADSQLSLRPPALLLRALDITWQRIVDLTAPPLALTSPSLLYLLETCASYATGLALLASKARMCLEVNA